MDCVTRWNSTLAMLVRARELSTALNYLTTSEEKLRDSCFDKDDFKQIDDLVNILSYFEEATKMMTSASKPTISETILVFSTLKNFLENHIEDIGSDKIEKSRSLLKKPLEKMQEKLTEV